MLTWSLVIATCNRPDALRRCVEQAVRQTRLPAEIVIVDASDGWAASRDRLAAEVFAGVPQVTVRYEAARQRSLPVQRNQGIDLATGDVLFMIDDDSFMYPDCAARVMEVYDADTDRAVAGVTPVLVPVDPAMEGQAGSAAAADPVPARRPSLTRRMRAHLASLLDVERLLLPYDPAYPEHRVPPGLDLTGLNTAPTRYFHGMRMTYRREVIARERFDEMLRGYAAAEDLDASYRASRHGMLLIAFNARLYHAEAQSGRLSRFTRTSIGFINLAALYRVKCCDPQRALRTLRRRILQRTTVDLLRDLAKGRVSVPAARADVFALRTMRVVRQTPTNQLSGWLQSFQDDLLHRNPK